VERRLAAVLAADVAGYSRLMGGDEVGTLAALKMIRREIVDPAIASHKGRIVKTTGDGMLVEFASAVDAVTCAMAVQEEMTARNAGSTPKIIFRIGINVGDIIIDGDDIFGDGVNIAARVESECAPGGVFLSGNAFEQVRDKTGFAFDDLGERSLKNIDRPVRLHAVRIASSPAASAISRTENPGLLPLPDKPSIAVLAFQNMSGDSEQQYFADGMVEDIITALSRFKSLFVIARNSSFTYRSKAVDIKQIGRELGVRYILEGSVRKAGGQLRITGQLIEASTGAHLWANKFDAPVENVFELQDRLTASLVGTIAPRLVNAEVEAARRKRPNDLSSYDRYLRGLSHLHEFSPASCDRAHMEALKAIELDPKFAPAFGLAAFSLYARKFNLGHELSDAEVKEAIQLINSALELDHDDEFVLAQASIILANMADEFERGLVLANRAIALNANAAGAYTAKGWSCLFLGKFDDGSDAFTAAIRLNPLDRWNLRGALRGLASICSMSRRYTEALQWANQCLTEIDSRDLLALLIACDAHLRLDRPDEARAAADKMSRFHPYVTNGLLKEAFRHFRRPEDLARVDEVIASVGLP
jgi:adenylate cyclase